MIPQRVAVTGSAGFIGSRVVADLEARGREVVGIDSATGGDILTADLTAALDGCGAVIHLAGRLGTAELFDTPHEAVDVNVHGTLRVLEACEATGAGYVGISMPQVWSNVYQATKLCAISLADAWHRHRGVPVSHVRAFNAFGPGQKLGPVRKIMPTFAHAAWLGEPIEVWGDGSQPVDLIFVDDVARLLVEATGVRGGQTIDAGCGQSLTVRQVAELVAGYAGKGSEIVHHPMRPGEHETDICASGEGWDLLECEPPVLRFADIFATVEAYK